MKYAFAFLSFIISLLFLTGCSDKNKYDGEITELPFSLTFGMTRDEVNQKIDGYEYEEVPSGKVRKLIITDGLAPGKYEKITLSLTSFASDLSLFQRIGLTDKLSEEVWLLYQVEYVLAEEQGTIDDMFDRFAERYPGFIDTGPKSRQRDTFALYKLRDIFGPDDEKYEVACIVDDYVKEEYEMPSVFAMSVDLHQKKDHVEVVFNANVLAIINFIYSKIS